MNLIIYALCTGLTRGAALLYFPFLIALLSIEDFGIWSVSFVTANLFAPLLSIGGTNSIIREGSEIGAEKVASKLTFNFIFISTVVTVMCFILINTVDSPNWLLYSIVMGYAFSIFELLGSYSRAIDKPVFFLFVSLSRVFGLFFAIIFALALDLDLTNLLFYQSIFLVALAIITATLFKLLNIIDYELKFHIEMKKHVKFSMSLIPHSVFQWISSSSDRIVINFMMGPYATGVYSLLYNFASVLMLANSALSLFIQPYVIKNYKTWTITGQATNWFGIYSLFSVVLFILSSFVLIVDSKLGYFFDSYSKVTLLIFTSIYAGIYFLGGYSFYVPWLFYGRLTKSITYITVFIAFINLALTTVLVFYYGLLGAAISTLVSYLIYFILVRNQVLENFSDLNFKPIRIIFFAIVLIFAFLVLFASFIN